MYMYNTMDNSLVQFVKCCTMFVQFGQRRETVDLLSLTSFFTQLVSDLFTAALRGCGEKCVSKSEPFSDCLTLVSILTFSSWKKGESFGWRSFLVFLRFSSAESYVGKGRYLKRVRYHARGRFGIEHRKFCHFFLVVEEGPVKEKNMKRRLKHMTELEEIKRHPRHIRNSLAWW